MKLDGKGALITGGNSGIGSATAALLASEGAAVVLTGRNQERGEQVAEAINEDGGNAMFLCSDVRVADECRRAIERTLERFGRIDVLFNNAGVFHPKTVPECTEQEWDEVLGVNLKGIFLVAQTAARHMIARGSGVILNTASTAGSTGYPHYADYSASKGGVIALTMSMALELAPAVRVNAVSPGYVLTPMQRAEYSDAMLDAVNRKIPFGRHARPGEIAALFAFLASDDAGFATGHVYVMDGGETTGGLCSQWTHE